MEALAPHPEDLDLCMDCGDLFPLKDMRGVIDDPSFGGYVCQDCEDAHDELAMLSAYEAETEWWESQDGQAELDHLRRMDEEDALDAMREGW